MAAHLLERHGPTASQALVGVSVVQNRYGRRMVRLTVARVGNGAVGGDPYPPDEEWIRPWADRPRTELVVGESELLGPVIARALPHLGVELPWAYSPYGIAFWSPEHDEGDGIGSSYALPVLRADGSADWRPWATVFVRELEASAGAGLIPGDHRRLYAFVLPQVGNGELPTWPELIHMLGVLKEVALLLEIPGGLAATYWLLKGRPDRAERAVQRKSTDWESRGLDPYTLDHYLDRHSWHPAVLAQALGCDEQETEAVLWALGFARSEGGLWRRAADSESETMDRIHWLLLTTPGAASHVPQLKVELKRRLQHLIDTGQAHPARDWDELPWLEPVMPGNAAGRARRRRDFYRFLRVLRKRPD